MFSSCEMPGPWRSSCVPCPSVPCAWACFLPCLVSSSSRLPRCPPPPPHAACLPPAGSLGWGWAAYNARLQGTGRRVSSWHPPLHRLRSSSLSGWFLFPSPPFMTHPSSPFLSPPFQTLPTFFHLLISHLLLVFPPFPLLFSPSLSSLCPRFFSDCLCPCSLLPPSSLHERVLPLSAWTRPDASSLGLPCWEQGLG